MDSLKTEVLLTKGRHEAYHVMSVHRDESGRMRFGSDENGDSDGFTLNDIQMRLFKEKGEVKIKSYGQVVVGDDYKKFAAENGFKITEAFSRRA